jgi:hypothetical protein
MGWRGYVLDRLQEKQSALCSGPKNLDSFLGFVRG